MLHFSSAVKSISRALLGGALLLLAACATIVPTEQLIEQRATARWDAILSGNLEDAYAYLSPGYRSSVSSLQYQRSILLKTVHWTGAEYIESDCVETTCKVKISLDYTVYAAIPGVKSYSRSKVIEESWLQLDGSWYLVPKK